ncbi:uncharacterized protein LOC127123061 [Lathyrus oleraceus]|uniref:uncharacterized protein LOC127123061 n=1 Tax=Pisum sativum TaxID=3888 RepID=UPI0021CEE61D|nr:uncharacterized protein LOC127123061 [Pisum sativum]
MLAEEVDDWWINTRQVLDAAAEVVTWVVFHKEFLRKYFPEDVCRKKEIEFLELKHDNLSVTEYAARFVELAKFYPHYIERDVDGKSPSGGGAATPLKCYRCNEFGHRISECKSDVKKCYKCGKLAHLVADCKENVVTCYNYGEPGHISTYCVKPKKASTKGKVFALARTQISSDDRLGLVVSSMSGEMVIKTHVKGSVATTLFLTPGEEEKASFLSTRQLKELLEECNECVSIY